MPDTWIWAVLVVVALSGLGVARTTTKMNRLYRKSLAMERIGDHDARREAATDALYLWFYRAFFLLLSVGALAYAVFRSL